MRDKTFGELFWGNLDDCLEKYKVSKADLSEIIYQSQDHSVYRKSAYSIYASIRRLICEKNSPNNAWANTIKNAIRVIDTDNKDCPVEFSDLLTDGFYKE